MAFDDLDNFLEGLGDKEPDEDESSPIEYEVVEGKCLLNSIIYQKMHGYHRDTFCFQKCTTSFNPQKAIVRKYYYLIANFL